MPQSSPKAELINILSAKLPTMIPFVLLLALPALATTASAAPPSWI